MTVQEFINSALRLIGVLDPGETPSSDESDQALEVANLIIDSWSAEGVMVPKITVDSVTMTGAADYSAPADTLKILSARVESTTGASMPVEVVDAARWAQAGLDIAESGLFAEILFFDGAQTSGKLYLWPRPSAGTLYLQLLEPLTALGALADTVALPGKGYERALRYALALDLATEYGRPIDAAIADLANGAKGAIVKHNSEVLGTGPVS